MSYLRCLRTAKVIDNPSEDRELAHNQERYRLSAIMLSRTLFLATDVGGIVRSESPIPARALMVKKKEHIRAWRVTNDIARNVLADIVGWLCRRNPPQVLCVATYGAFVGQEASGPWKPLSAISANVEGPLCGADLRAELASMWPANIPMPLIVLETDVGAYAVGENFVRSLPNEDGSTDLTIHDPVVFGFFTGGVGAAISKNLQLNRGLNVGMRGKIPVHTHSLDLEIGFEPSHPIPFSLEAHTSIASIKSRAQILDGFSGPFQELCELCDAKVWDVFAYYVAQFCYSMIVNYSPKVIVLGGLTIIQADFVLERIRASFSELLGENRRNFLDYRLPTEDLSDFICRQTSIETCLYGSLQIANQNIPRSEQ